MGKTLVVYYSAQNHTKRVAEQIAAWPVNGFVEANNFSGKTVIPFVTSTSSGLGQSGELLQALANGGDWQTGHRFSFNPSDSDIKNWTDSIN